jgi:ribose 1,5-bisphosphate isomerase
LDTLEKIRNDHVSGATEIAIRCAEYLREQTEHFSGEEPDQFVLHLNKIGTQLKEAQPAMASVYNAVSSILISTQNGLKNRLTLQQLQKIADNAALNFIDSLKCALKQLAEEGVVLIKNGQEILTYSSSRAVMAVLKKAKEQEKKFGVIVPESRPMYEGRILAQDLGSIGIHCIMIVDGAISTFVDHADIVLIGADRISEHSVVNKIGTYALALMARQKELPLYCACETSKFLRSDLLPFTQNEMDPEEVWEKTPENVAIKNLYFEEIPLNLFTGIITERGILADEEVRNLISKNLS